MFLQWGVHQMYGSRHSAKWDNNIFEAYDGFDVQISTKVPHRTKVHQKISIVLNDMLASVGLCNPQRYSAHLGAIS